jgi:hypothetical protein
MGVFQRANTSAHSLQLAAYQTIQYREKSWDLQVYGLFYLKVYL